MASARARTAWVVTALLCIAPVAIVQCARDIADEPPVVTGQLWSARFDGAPLILYVTREERSKSVPVVPRSRSWRYEPYSRFHLVTRRIPEGTVADSVHLGDLERPTETHVPKILGVVGDIVWMWRDSLEGRSLRGLTLAATFGTLTKGALEAPAPLPTEASGYAIRSDPVSLIARGRDARFYVIDGVRQRIDPLDPATLPATTFSTQVEDRFNYLIPPGRSRSFTSVSNILQQHFLTSTKLWYALLSESEASQLSRWPSGESHPYGDVGRSLYRTAYRLDDRNQPELDPKRLTTVGSERLLKAGFLVRYQQRVWDVPDPSSSLVLAKRNIGSAEPWDVVRLTRDGAVVWRASTGLDDPNEMLDLGTHLVLVGPAPVREGTVERRELLVWIDERTGAVRTLSIDTGEVK